MKTIFCLVVLLGLLSYALTTPLSRRYPKLNLQSILSEKSQESVAESVKNAMDRSADPCTDFYQFACGGWIANTTLPPDQGRIVRSFQSIEERNYQALLQILANPQQLDPVTRDFYQSCMNLDAIEQDTWTLSSLLMFIGGALDRPGPKNLTRVFEVAGAWQKLGVTAFASLGSGIDSKSPKNNLLQFAQPSLSLPDISFYLDTSDEGQKLLALYQKHVANMFTLATSLIGGDPVARAKDVLDIETAIAKISLSPSDLRDPFKTYNKMTFDHFTQQVASNIPLSTYFKAAGVPASVSEMNVATPDYFVSLNSLLANPDMTNAKFASYFHWLTLHTLAPFLSSAYRNEDFDFFGKVIMGNEEQLPRNITCLLSTDESIGMLLSKYFVDKLFPGESKSIAVKMINDIKQAFNATLQKVEWMDEKTRQAALTKLSLVGNMIGFPEPWPQYTGLRVSSSYVLNKVVAKSWAFEKNIASAGGPSERGDWEMTPETVNAYYSPEKNQMVFPAAILQNPMFDRAFPTSMNYGAIGMVMGHELSHGFDDQGRLYDGTGTLTDWWSPSVGKAFKTRADCLIQQYSGYEVLPGVHVNGNLTLGENIADNAGIKDAFIAYSTNYGPEGQQPSIVEGLNNYQLFFVAYAQGWCAKVRPEIAKARVLTDPHSPPQFRVIGPLSNSPDFARVYSCPVGSPMNPENKCGLF